MWHRWLQSLSMILSVVLLFSATENNITVKMKEEDPISDRNHRIQIETDILPVGNNNKNNAIYPATAFGNISIHAETNSNGNASTDNKQTKTPATVNNGFSVDVAPVHPNYVAVEPSDNFIESDATVPFHQRNEQQSPSSAKGPFFEDGPGHCNVTAKLGTTVLLDCRIGLLYDKTVTWLRRKSESIHLLTVGRYSYSVDQRISLSFRYPNNWRLQISSVTRRDDGLYECQIATHPPVVKYTFLKVLAPEVKILDEKSRPVTERYYKAGSTIRLSCVAKQAEGNPSDSIVWSREKTLLSMGITTNSSPGVIVSSLKIPKAQNHHSGKYTCTVDQLAIASVTLHILNGELPAAIHGGSSNVSQSVTILILILCLLLVSGTDFPNR